MKIVSEREQIQGVADSWLECYPKSSSSESNKRIHKELLALDKNKATAKDVSDIIGNETWVNNLYCDECGEVKNILVILGAAYVDDSIIAKVCKDCLNKAKELLT